MSGDLPQSEQRLGSVCEFVTNIGSGAMGQVVLVEHPQTRKRYALKTAKVTKDTSYLKRFERESRLARRLDHPYVVKAYETGYLGEGMPYIITEYYPNGNLADRLRSLGPVAPADAARWMAQTVEALDYAWNTHRMVHRDIKPANLLLDSDDDIKISDLGFAKRLAPDGTVITEEGVTLGSPHYISPEQAEAGCEIDHRCDMYSIGASFYQLLTGQTLFEGNTQADIMVCHIRQQPRPPRELRSDIPVDLEALLLHLLAKKPTDRPETYAELADQIRRMHIPAGRAVASVAFGAAMVNESSGAYKPDSTVLTDGRGMSDGVTRLNRAPGPECERWEEANALLEIESVETGAGLTAVVLTRFPVKCGRSPGTKVDLQLRLYPVDECRDDAVKISGLHCEFGREDGQWALRERGSRNGTSVNSRELHPGEWFNLCAPTDIGIGDALMLRGIPLSNTMPPELELDGKTMRPAAWPALVLHRISNRPGLCYLLLHERAEISADAVRPEGYEGQAAGSLWWLDGVFWWQPSDGNDLVPLGDGAEWASGGLKMSLRRLQPGDLD